MDGMTPPPASRPSAPPSDPRERITDFWHCAKCGGRTSGKKGDGWACRDCGTDTTVRVEAIMHQEWPSAYPAPAPRSGDGDPPPPLTTEKRAEIQELATGEHAGKEWGGVLADRYFIAYEATVRELESTLASQRAARARAEEIVKAAEALTDADSRCFATNGDDMASASRKREAAIQGLVRAVRASQNVIVHPFHPRASGQPEAVSPQENPHVG